MPISQFVVPQFIDVEDKIVGPITTRQFIIIISVFLLGFISFKAFNFGTFIGIAIVLIVLMILFAFIKVNGRPFHYFVLNVVAGFNSPNMRVWRKIGSRDIVGLPPSKEKEAEPTASIRPNFSTRLSELSLIVDTGGVYKAQGLEDQSSKSKAQINIK